MVHLTVCYHVTFAFQSESSLYSWRNVKKLLAWSRHDIWGLSDSNRIGIHSKMPMWYDNNIQSNVPYRQILTMRLNDLSSWAKWLCVCLGTKWLWVQILLLSLKLQILCVFWARSLLTLRQLWSVDSLRKGVHDIIATCRQIRIVAHVNYHLLYI